MRTHPPPPRAPAPAPESAPGFPTSASSPTPPPRPPSRRLRRWAGWIIGLCLAALLLIGLVVLGRNPILKFAIQYQIRAETGLAAEIGAVQLDLQSSSLRLTDFRIRSGAEFDGWPLLEMPELFFQVCPPRQNNPAISLAEVRMHLASINVVKNKHGQLNLTALRKRTAKKHHDKSNRPSTAGFIPIEQLSVTLGTLRYIDCADARNNVEFNLGIANQTFHQIQSEQDLQNCVARLMARIAWAQYLNHPGEFRSRLWQMLRETLF